MKPLLLAILILCLPPLSAHAAGGMPNPSAVYCLQMGYDYEQRTDAAGNVVGICVFPDGTEAPAWDFFRGKAGRKFSYCAKKGYETRTRKTEKDGCVMECAQCVRLSRKGGVTAAIDMLDLMDQNNEPLRLDPGPKAANPPKTISDPPAVKKKPLTPPRP